MRIIFYRSLAGREPVHEYLSGLPLRDRAAAADVLYAIRGHGLQAPGVRFKQIREKLLEFYVEAKAPVQEIETAIRRMKEVLHEF